MKTRVILVLLSVVMILGLAGCYRNTIKLSESFNVEDYLKDKGYTIVSKEGKIDEYVLTKELLLKMPDSEAWGLQHVNAKDYLNKKIELYKFTVTNHPLEKIYTGYNNFQTIITVMVCENSIIGGTSVPYLSDGTRFAGGLYSLDGKTLEEVTGLSARDWANQWDEKYK